MKKQFLVLALATAMITLVVGCGDDTVSNENTANTIHTPTTAVQESETPTEEAVHEHRLVYTFDAVNSHRITCADESCEYAESGTCVYDADYVCSLCGNKHEHEYSYVSNSDGTHAGTCGVCSYSESVECVLNEEYVCGVCGWMHEHDCVVSANEDDTHTYSCKYTCCTYSYSNDCEFTGYECVCGNVYPWEQDIEYFDEKEKGVYYAQRELKIYRYPDTDSEVIGTLGVDEGINCVGSIFRGSGSKYENYYITEEGGCISIKFRQAKSRWDLSPAKTSQVIVIFNNNTHGTYNGYDEALQAVCESTWTQVKSSWQYNDYKSQGLSFMNSYSNQGVTVATKDGSVPYNCSMGNDVIYYFQ